MAILDAISNPDTVLRLRLIVYGLLIFFSFFIFIGVAVMKDEAKLQTKSGIIDLECPLYVESDNSHAVSTCNFPMAIAIMFQLLFLLFRLGTLLLLVIGRMSSESVLFSDMMDFAWVVTEFFAFFFTFIGACILSAGTNDTCDFLNGISKNDDFCSTLDWYSPSQAAQAGAWISTLLWIFIFVVGIVSMYRTGRLPFGRAAPSANASGGAAPRERSSAPNMDTPPNNPDGMQPRY